MTRSNYLSLLAKAKEMVAQGLAKSPKYGVLIHAAEQLETIQKLMDSKQPITSADIAKVDIGLMAARELEQSDPEFADLLQRLDYYLPKI